MTNDLLRTLNNYLDSLGQYQRELLDGGLLIRATERIKELEAEVEQLKSKKCVHELVKEYSESVEQ